MTNSVSFTLPYPPSANRYWRSYRGRVVKSEEARRYSELKFLAAAGQISDLECHPKYDLYAGITYKPDFRYIENGKTVCEDVKSKPTKTRDFVMRWKMAKDIYKDCEWRMIG